MVKHTYRNWTFCFKIYRTTMLHVIGMLLFVYVCNAEVANEYKDKIIETHNQLRRKQNAKLMFELTWDDTLAREADAWISQCRFEHENKGRGENLAFNQGGDIEHTIETAFTNWYDEIKMYNYAGKKCFKSCHYTQLVWSTTRHVGCAIKKCPSLRVFGRQVSDAWIFGCWYDPKGNDNTEYPYIPGPPCSECWEGQTCVNGLCSGEGKEKCFDKDKNCETYALSTCKSNEAYMAKQCRQTCEFCTGGPKKECVDVSPDCARYGTRTCQSNIQWMKPNCRKTCNFC